MSEMAQFAFSAFMRDLYHHLISLMPACYPPTLLVEMQLPEPFSTL